jgi:RimJ/RimL family protein N-acetyltransferase
LIEFPVEGLSDGDVRLRLHADADIPAIVEACQDPEIPRWTRVPDEYTESDALEWFDRQDRRRDEGEALELLIVEDETDALLGSIGFVSLDHEERVGELGYWLARDARGRGVATRALHLISRWAFDALPVDRISIVAQSDNERSRRLAERAGFTYEGVLRSYTLIKGRRRDIAMYSLLRDEANGAS